MPVLTSGIYCSPASQLDHKETKNKDIFCMMLPDLRENVCCGEGSQVWPVWPSGNSNIKMMGSMVQEGE